jgi:flagellar hook assembly protein FlgD
VRTLVDGEVDVGEHVAVWDGRTDAGDRAASGVYFVRMETHAFRAVRKAVLLK